MGVLNLSIIGTYWIFMENIMENLAEAPARLLVVATPLGNPGDLSPRAREALATSDYVLAEDTRRTGLLLSSCGLKARQLISFHDHNEEHKIAGLLDLLRQGKTLALVSDAGTPLLSDPGYRLVRAAREAGLPVSPLPGPSAPLAALSASGLPPLPFIFLGFPPRKSGDRVKFFSPYARLDATLIFFERKDRLADTLSDIIDLLGKRECCIAREITKTFEEFILFPLEEYEKYTEGLLGELTVLLGPPLSSGRSSEHEVDSLLAELQAEQALKPRALARAAHKELCGWSVDELYSRISSTKKVS